MELPYVKGARFTGLERLAVVFAEKLHGLGHDVSLLAHKDTFCSQGVHLLPCEGYVNNDRTIHAELKAYTLYSSVFRKFDVIWDIGHLHLAARFQSNLPTVNVLNHAPVHAKYPKASYNIVSWSKWGVQSFRQVYGQNARYQETIAIEPEIYYCPDDRKRGERFLTIGRMHPDKGNFNAAKLCKKLGLPLDICGGRGSERAESDPPTEYEQACMDIADGTLIRFLGEVNDAQKIELMQRCRCLLYVTDHVEITSHKVQEAMFCGAPAIVPNLGGLPEIITPGVNGYACYGETEYEAAIKNVDNLQPEKAYQVLYDKYNVAKVVEDYVKLYMEVANGLRW